MKYIRTVYGRGISSDTFEIDVGGLKEQFSFSNHDEDNRIPNLSNTTKPWREVYKEVVACIPKEELMKALLNGHQGAINARKYLQES